MFTHEMLPCAFVPGRASTSQGEVLQMQRRQVPLERARIWLCGKRLPGTSLERRCKRSDRQGPAIRPRRFVQARDESVRNPPGGHASL